MALADGGSARGPAQTSRRARHALDPALNRSSASGRVTVAARDPGPAARTPRVARSSGDTRFPPVGTSDALASESFARLRGFELAATHVAFARFGADRPRARERARAVRRERDALGEGVRVRG